MTRRFERIIEKEKDRRKDRKRAAKSCGISSLALMLVASATSTTSLASSLRVRGVDLKTPLELRILVQDIDVQAVSKKTKFSLSASGLNVIGGPVLAGGNLNCEVFADPLVFLGNFSMKKNARWWCQGADFQKFLDEGPLQLSSDSGFIMAGDNSYRGKLELASVGPRLLVINDLDLEGYLAGLVNKEIRSSYPPEAVKAQIIAARSYALATAADRRRAGALFDMYGTEQDQVYDGSLSEDAASHRFVEQTRGQVLVHQANIIKAYYHASSGGYSELPQNVWGGLGLARDSLAFLARLSVIDQDLKGSKWEVQLSAKMGLAWPDLGELSEVRVLERSLGQRVKRIKLVGSKDTKILSGPEFRKRFGPRWIRSTYFSVLKQKGGWQISGNGFGHGVGLSQLGARALARSGQKAKDILSHYYPFAHVEQIFYEDAATASLALLTTTPKAGRLKALRPKAQNSERLNIALDAPLSAR